LLLCCIALACGGGSTGGHSDSATGGSNADSGAAGAGGGPGGAGGGDGAAGAGNSGGATQDAGSSRANCMTNSDCAAPEVCYRNAANGCTGGALPGQCLRMDPACTNNSQCECLVGAGTCGANQGGMCIGDTQPTGCWYCRLPV